MKVTNLNTYFVFGWNYQILQNGFQGGFHIQQCVDIIDEFLKFIKEYELEITIIIIGNKLQKMKKDLKKKFEGKLETFIPADEKKNSGIISKQLLPH